MFGNGQRCERQRLGRRDRGVGVAGRLVGRRARVGERHGDVVALAEERPIGRVEERGADRGRRRHHVVPRVDGVCRARVGRAEAVQVRVIGEVRVDAGTDRAERIAVEEAGEVAELVGADRRRHVDDIRQGVGRVVGPAEELADVDRG